MVWHEIFPTRKDVKLHHFIKYFCKNDVVVVLTRLCTVYCILPNIYESCQIANNITEILQNYFTIYFNNGPNTNCVT